jgi:hypothetical protein
MVRSQIFLAEAGVASRRAPKGVTIWQAFDKILNEANVVITPARFRLEGRSLFPHQRLQQPRQRRGSRAPVAGVEVVTGDQRGASQLFWVASRSDFVRVAVAFKPR